MNWYIKVLKRYFDFRGRARRTELWMFHLFNLLVLTALYAFRSLMMTMFSVKGPEAVASVLILIYFLGMIIPTLAVSARRLHDQDKSGWLLLMHFIPLVGIMIVFVYMVTEGTRGHNQYGPDPKQRNNEIDDIGR